MFLTFGKCPSANVSAESGTSATAEAKVVKAASSDGFSFPFPTTYRPEIISY
jgi:hypothetical protein